MSRYRSYRGIRKGGEKDRGNRDRERQRKAKAIPRRARRVLFASDSAARFSRNDKRWSRGKLRRNWIKIRGGRSVKITAIARVPLAKRCVSRGIISRRDDTTAGSPDAAREINFRKIAGSEKLSRARSFRSPCFFSRVNVRIYRAAARIESAESRPVP